MKLDVAIVGGGPAGATAALALARRGYRVGVIEPGDRTKAGECISPRGATFLSHIGLIDPETEGHRRSPGMRVVWGKAKFERDFINHAHGRGWNLDRAKFEAGLKSRAIRAGADWITARLVEVLAPARPFQLVCRGADGQKKNIDAATVIDGSGRSAAFARRIGARHVVGSNLTAAHFRFRGPVEDPRLLVESVEGGWWYSAGLSDGLVASFQSATARRCGLPRGLETETRLVGLTASASHRFAAGSLRLDRMSGIGWLAIGDAAAAYDPLFGHGIAAAIASGFHGADAIGHWLAGDRDALHHHAERRASGWNAFNDGLSQQYANTNV